jgi:hypothetical protein
MTVGSIPADCFFIDRLLILAILFPGRYLIFAF